jgi:hypothetical protein
LAEQFALTPQQQMQAITLGSGGIAGAAVGLLIYAFWPQPLHLNLLSKGPVQAPQFVDSAKETAKPATILAGTPAPAVTLAAAPAAAIPATPQQGPATSVAPAPTAAPLAFAATPASVVATTAANAFAAQTPAMTRGIGPIAAASPTADANARTLLAEGVALLAQGEIASSRLLLEQAANAGESRAWVALGDSYDPAVLTRLGALGVKGDSAMARDCYTKAASAGLSEARERIAALGAL